MAAINLKVKTVNRFIAITITYFTFAIIVNGLIPAVQQATSGEFTNKHWDEIFQQYFDLGTILALLFVFRPRVWPDYFTIGLFNGEDQLEQIQETNNALVQQYRVVPFLKSEINRSFLDRSGTSNNTSFTSGQQVIILEPFEGTLHSEERGWLDRFNDRQNGWKAKVFSNLIWGQSQSS